MTASPDKYDDALIISRLQQIELTSLKPTLSTDSPFFHLLTLSSQKPFFDNMPLGFGLELSLIGNKIIGVNIERGYFSHDLEASLSRLSTTDAFLAIERLNFVTPIFYQAALYLAYKRISDQNIPAEHARFFTIAMEFGRVAHHLSVIKNVLYCLRLTSLAEIAVDIEEILAAPLKLLSRVSTTPKSLDRDNLADVLTDALARAEELSFSLSLEDKIKNALHKKAVISMSQAGSMGLTGLFLRANQDLYDLRRQSNQTIPYVKPPRISVGEGGDAWMRFTLRGMDVLASLQWLKLTFLDATPVTVPVLDDDFCNFDPRCAYSFGEVEGALGDIKVSIFVTPNKTPLFRIRSPAYHIAQAMPSMLVNLELDDVAAIIFSLGITAAEVDK